MRDRQQIKNEIDAVQEDLEHNIAQLKDAITDKVDIKTKVHDKVEEKKSQAMDAVVRVRRNVLDYYARTRQFVRDKPFVVAGVAASVVLVGSALLAIRSRMRAPAHPPIRNVDDLLLAIEEKLHYLAR